MNTQFLENNLNIEDLSLGGQSLESALKDSRNKKNYYKINREKIIAQKKLYRVRKNEIKALIEDTLQEIFIKKEPMTLKSKIILPNLKTKNRYKIIVEIIRR